MLVTVIAEFNAKTTNSEKAIYFLSLMSCSMDKLKSHMFFACKIFFFLILRGKKHFDPENGGGEGAGWRSPTPLSYSPEYIDRQRRRS